MLCCYKVVLQLDFSLFGFHLNLAKLRGATPGYSIMRNVHPKWCYF